MITQRINEDNNASCILFIDEDIMDCGEFTLDDQIVSSRREAESKLEDILHNNEIDDRIEAQRNLLPTYESQLELIYDKVFGGDKNG